MESSTLNTTQGAPPPSPAAPASEPRKKTMSPAAIAANRANALKSTGPRTAANAFQHGLYSMSNFTHLIGHPDLVATTVHNLLEEYQPVTPTEHILVQQLIHLQLRFLQMENFLNQYLLEGKHEAPDRATSQIEPTHPTGPQVSQSITEYIYQEFCRRLDIDPNNPPTRDEPIPPPGDKAL